jgi:hypothetical protein
MEKKSNFSRRTILKTILWTPPMLMFSPGGLFAAEDDIKPLYQPRIIPKGQKIRLAQIGVFNRGGQLLDAFKSHTDQVEYVAFADVLFTSKDYQMKGFQGVPCFTDYREMFEKLHDKIDGVIIGTPDFAHFPMVMHAMLLGKHVYVEKPMAQNVYECRLLEKVARKTGVVTQMGNQGHSGFGTIQFGQWVKAGLIKNVKRVDSWMTAPRRWHGWTLKAYPEAIPPAGYDWDQWLCRRPFRPYSDKLIDGNWRCWYDFGCGALGDWGAHVLDAIYRYLELDQPYEISTELIGPSDLYYPQGSVITFKFGARGDLPPVEVKWYDGQGNLPAKPAGYPKDLVPIGSMVYLDNAVVTGTSHGARYHFEMNDRLEQMEKEDKLPKPEGSLPDHYHNFLNACQGIEKTNSPFEIGAPLAELLCLGCIAQRFGGTLKYDAKAMKITNHAEADKMLTGPEVRDRWTAYDNLKPAASKISQIKDPKDVQWEPLFKDASLSNWENPYDWGQAEYKDGVVSLTSEQGKWFFLTKKEYANFVFEGEIKMPENEGNSGFMFRCQKAKNKAWGYQAEVDTAVRKWSGGLYDEGRRMWFISPNKDKAANPAEAEASIKAFRDRAGDSYKQGQWNTYRIVCVGPHIQIYVNDTLTTDVYDGMDLKGHIAIQHHGEKGLVYQFRNLRIKDLGTGGEIYYPHREKAAAGAVASKMDGDIYEAEDAKMEGCNIANNQDGFQGKGFADFGGAGSSVEWGNVLAEKAGEFMLTFRYAASSNRPCELVVNGEKVGRLNFDSTGGWTNWKTIEMKASFKQGGNSVKVVSISDGPNLDAMAVTK